MTNNPLIDEHNEMFPEMSRIEYHEGEVGTLWGVVWMVAYNWFHDK